MDSVYPMPDKKREKANDKDTQYGINTSHYLQEFKKKAIIVSSPFLGEGTAPHLCCFSGPGCARWQRNGGVCIYAVGRNVNSPMS